MKVVIVCILATSTIICASGWYINRLVAKGFVRFIVKKGYTLPSQEEIRACIKDVIRAKFSKKS